jgi:tRNA(Ile)-lysidine synthase
MLEKIILESDFLDKLSKYDSIKIGFSGGLDSSVLLHLLASVPAIFDKIVAIHVNHGLSKYASSWEQHCLNFCNELGVKIICFKVNINNSSNIEANARRARYKVFQLNTTENDCIVFAHHANDQAETLLLNLLRGSGVDGLSAMPEFRKLGNTDLLRPLLKINRNQLENYAILNKLTWITDESNYNLAFSRNYLRNVVMPLLTDRWPRAIDSIANCAQKCQTARRNLDYLAHLDADLLDSVKGRLAIYKLPLYDKDRLVNILRLFLKKNNIISPSTKIFEKIIDEVIFAKQDSNPCINLDCDFAIRRYQGFLYLSNIKNNYVINNEIWHNFPEPFTMETGAVLNAFLSSTGVSIAKDSLVEIRTRRGGEVIRLNGQSKKLKKLFQEWQVLPWQRDVIPLIYVDNILKVVVGYADADDKKSNINKYLFT